MPIVLVLVAVAVIFLLPRGAKASSAPGPSSSAAYYLANGGGAGFSPDVALSVAGEPPMDHQYSNSFGHTSRAVVGAVTKALETKDPIVDENNVVIGWKPKAGATPAASTLGAPAGSKYATAPAPIVDRPTTAAVPGSTPANNTFRRLANVINTKLATHDPIVDASGNVTGWKPKGN